MSQRETILNVAGMSCPSCSRHVTAALTSVPGVSNVDVRLKAGTVLIRHEVSASTSTMLEALREAGYDAKIHGGPLQADAGAPSR